MEKLLCFPLIFFTENHLLLVSLVYIHILYVVHVLRIVFSSKTAIIAFLVIKFVDVSGVKIYRKKRKRRWWRFNGIMDGTVARHQIDPVGSVHAGKRPLFLRIFHRRGGVLHTENYTPRQI